MIIRLQAVVIFLMHLTILLLSPSLHFWFALIEPLQHSASLPYALHWTRELE
jgi:hypothetical protein